jgi:transcriptional regulator with XRE-family HTH domain
MGLREKRQLKRLTQEQLADRSGVDQTNISAIETGKNRNPSWETVARLSIALSADPFELFPLGDDASGPRLPLEREVRA